MANPKFKITRILENTLDILDKILVTVGFALFCFGAVTIESEDPTIPYAAVGLGLLLLLPVVVRSVKYGDREGR